MVEVSEIVVHKADQPDPIVDFFNTHRLTCERSAEIDFLFVNADSSATGDKSCPIVEGIGKLSDAAVRPRGGLVDVGGALHSESFMRALVVELAN